LFLSAIALATSPLMLETRGECCTCPRIVS
jgi:hypothetical protein